MTTEPAHMALEYAQKKSPWQLERNQGLAKGGHDEAVKNVMPVRTQGRS